MAVSTTKRYRTDPAAAYSNDSQTCLVSFADKDDIIEPNTATMSVGDNQISSSRPDTPPIEEEKLLEEDAFAADGTDLEEPVEFSPKPLGRPMDTCAINDDLTNDDKVTSIGGASLVNINGYR